MTLGTTLAGAEAAEIEINTLNDLNGWTPEEGNTINVTSDGDGGLLASVLSRIENNSTIILSNETYTANQYLVSKDGITITNASGVSPEIQLSAVSDGFKIQANNVTIQNVTLNGTGTANYGFRVQAADGTTFENVKATNMLKTAFDISRNTNAVYTNITAVDNGGFGITITQGVNITITGTTQNNGWGGLNVNNKQQNDENDIETTGINVSGVTSEETAPIILEQYTPAETGNDVSKITPPAGVDLTAGSIVISNEEGIGDGTMTAKFILLNPANTAEVNGQILSNVLTSSKEGNTIEIPDGSYETEEIIVPSNVVLKGNNVEISGTLAYTDGADVTIERKTETPAENTKSTRSGGSGTGSAIIVEASSAERKNTPNSNNAVTAEPTGTTSTENNAGNTNTNTNPADSGKTDSTNNDSRTTQGSGNPDRSWLNLIVVAGFVVLIGGAVYLFASKNE
ncbi:right-handed parallel beta-helix repeat-containing protein [Methanimicrococcus hacksteinii]|uniref:right-handed parallel beta-helix repeat-containing protein n=1 Tax=Methanimicrococcus hacksteinii TaxID=3028293 RepID=UPI00298F0784|nr:right-handed parallel beta-helix repeat-containing protein [Methanimicrococcus sp. At1]